MKRSRLTLGTAAFAAIWASMAAGSHAITDDARSYAIEAALPQLDAKDRPFSLRETWWAQDSMVGQPKIIRHQLFRRNAYWFWVATGNRKAKVSIHVYDSEGKLVDAEAFATGNAAGVRVVPKATGSYYIRVVVESSPDRQNHWSVVYGFR
jgi:hypothetical protein